MSPRHVCIVPLADRRLFLRGACGLALSAAALPLTGCGAGSSGFSATPQAAAVAPATPAAAPSTTPEQDVLNFALNLHYLGAQFYAYASAGAGVAAAALTGSGTPGAASGGRGAAFADPTLAQFVAEIAADKLASLTAVRAALAGAAVAQPHIDLSADSGGSFSTAARAAGIAAAGAAFDPYASDDAFLLSASMFEDVAAAAHRATLPLLAASPSGLEVQGRAAALAAYHAGVVRSVLDARAVARPELRTSRLALASFHARLDASPAGAEVVQDSGAVTDVPDVDGVTAPYTRSPQRALRVLYAYAGAASAGAFFPNGLNGAIRTSA